MPASSEVWISAVVEGDVDEAVLTRLADACGVSIASVFGRSGKHAVYQRLEAYNKAASYSPWIVLLDLDDDAQCARADFKGASESRGKALPQNSGTCNRELATG